MKRLVVLATGILMIGFTSALKAQTATPRVTNRQVKQEARIQQGVRSGELTRKEAAGLQMQQAAVQRHKKIAKADGVVTPCERRSIARHQNRANRNIAYQKHDAQKK